MEQVCQLEAWRVEGVDCGDVKYYIYRNSYKKGDRGETGRFCGTEQWNKCVRLRILTNDMEIKLEQCMR